MSPADQSQRQVSRERGCSTSPPCALPEQLETQVGFENGRFGELSRQQHHLLSGYARAALSLNPKPSFKLAPEHTILPLETRNVLL